MLRRTVHVDGGAGTQRVSRVVSVRQSALLVRKVPLVVAKTVVACVFSKPGRHTSRLSLAWLSSRAKQIEEERDPHEDEDLAGDVRKEGGRATQAAQERAGTVY